MASLTTPDLSPESPKRDVFDLNPAEFFWVTHQPFLELQGYRLRPRYQPGWIKSWIKTPDVNTEDAISPTMPVLRVMDATRVSDSQIVVLKRVKRIEGANEIAVTRYLSQEGFLSDARNHCVPLLDILDPGNGDEAFLVLPLLRHFDDPELESVDDAVNFIHQTLEGLVFMHEKGVAHRDCALFNIMMDAKDMYPEGFHPQRTFLTLDASRWAPVRRRYQAPFPKYYLIDFGLSERFLQEEGTRMVTGEDGQDQSVPELSATKPYDPFKVDIYTLGNVFKTELVLKYRGLSFLTPLIDRMTSMVPTDRPSATEALALLQNCQKRVFSISLYRRLTPIDQNFAVSFVREGWHLGRRMTMKGRSD